MRIKELLCLILISVMPLMAKGQDYMNPKDYIVGGARVEGNTYFSENQILQVSGLQKGIKVTAPGDDISSIVERLWAQRYFQDVAISIDSLSAAKDTAWFVISIVERPRVSRWTFSGVRSGEKKDLEERLNLRRGGEFSEYVEKTSSDIIKRFYSQKGFLNTKVEAQVQKDTIVKSAIRVNFHVDRGEKVRIKEINFIGNEHLKEFKLAKSMKKTKSNKIYNFFSSKKFDEKEYPNDKKGLISAFNEAGYRDAKIIKDSIYYVEPGRLGIDFYIDEGKQYYFRNISWTGNSVYASEDLNRILQIEKGDVYDLVTMQKRLSGGDKQNALDVSKVYRDNGYLFFRVDPVELNIEGDSVDVEMRIVEGKQATFNNIVINGNDLTSERIIRRQVFTRPGYLFSQSDFERSIREIASMGLFDAESISAAGEGYSIIPNQANNTVDLVYNVKEKPSSQVELSGGWGGRTFVGTVGLLFNNFSTKRILDKTAWRPVPLGDAQTLNFRFQTSGTYYTALSASFLEPWLFGKKPTSLSLSAYYTKQTNSYSALQIYRNDKQMEVFGLSASLGDRLKWPDNFFVMYNQFSWQTYKLKDWYEGYFIFDDGTAHNISYTLGITRNSTDQPIYPRQGANISFSLQLTPPFSLFRHKDLANLDDNGKPVYVKNPRDIQYDKWTAQQRYKWIEYHKWKVRADYYTKLIGDLVLRTGFQFGYLGYYNKAWGYSPFEGFMVGGDGMSGYNTYGTEVVSLRGYENYSLTPYEYSQYNSNGYSYAGNVYDKFTIELRYPVILQPQSQIFVLAFLEGGNAWSHIKDFNPFQIKRSAGFGARIFLPVVGLLGIDWGYGFDDKGSGGSQFHFLIGQEF